jgi:hypothetical protein
MNDSRPPKDFWDKLGALSTLFSSVVIGIVGLVVTSEFNQKQLEINQLQQQQQSDIELTKELEDLYPYLSADDPGKRKFGYAMFVALGREALALSLINANNDIAGQPVAASLTTSVNADIRARAVAVYSSLKLASALTAATPPPPANEALKDKLQQLIKTSSNPALKDVPADVPIEALLNSTNPKLDAVRRNAMINLVKP